MKKLLPVLILLIASVASAQSPIDPILKNYFRVHPFDITFSSFIKSLQQDPWFTIDTYDRRTDSTFFFLTGTYKNFNPYKYGAKEIRLIVVEDQFVHIDSLKTLDTIITLQLMGIADSANANESVVSKEYIRFTKKYGPGFWKSSYEKAERKNKTVAEISNFFIYPYAISPLTIAWGQLSDTKEYSFTITIRFKLKENNATMVLMPDEIK
jgi:hypothetical protein